MVIAGTAIEPILLASANQEIVAAIAGQCIEPRPADQGVAAAAAGQRVAAIEAEHNDRLAARAGVKNIVARRAVELGYARKMHGIEIAAMAIAEGATDD